MVDPNPKKNRDHRAVANNALNIIKKLEKQWSTLSDSLQHQEDILSKSIHDSRNRVTALLGFCSLLQSDDSNFLSEEQNSYIEDIMTNIHQLLSLIEKISDSQIHTSQHIEIEKTFLELKKAIMQNKNYN